MKEINVGVPMSRDLHEDLVAFRQRYSLDTDAGAARSAIRMGIRSPSLLFLILESFGDGKFDEIAEENPEQARSFARVFAEVLNIEAGDDLDLIKLADSIGVELGPDALRSFHRIEKGEAEAEDALRFFLLVPRITDQLQERHGEPEDSDELREMVVSAGGVGE